MGLDRLTLCRHSVVPITASVAARAAAGGGASGEAKPDDRILLGLQWLVETVESQLPALEERRAAERAQHKAGEEARRKARLSRLRGEEGHAQAQRADVTEASSASTGAGTEAGLAGGSSPAASPSPPPPPACKLCRTAPAVRRCAAAGWEAVCDPCGTKAEAERDRKREGGGSGAGGGGGGGGAPSASEAVVEPPRTPVHAKSPLAASPGGAPAPTPAQPLPSTPALSTSVHLVVTASPPGGEGGRGGVGSVPPAAAAEEEVEASRKPTLLAFDDASMQAQEGSTVPAEAPASPDVTMTVVHAVVSPVRGGGVGAPSSPTPHSHEAGTGVDTSGVLGYVDMLSTPGMGSPLPTGGHMAVLSTLDASSPPPRALHLVSSPGGGGGDAEAERGETSGLPGAFSPGLNPGGPPGWFSPGGPESPS